jgi:Rrf2 family nitric oxide-sensitive transcriptional repressor
MLLSKRSLYGIRAALLMASRADRSYLPASEISRRLGVSAHYLPKVLQDLTRAGITRSSRGPNGGIALRRPPADITLNEIIAAVEGTPDPAECPLSIDDCSPSDPCHFCQRLRAAQNQFTGLFDETTLADVRLCSRLLERDAERIDVSPRQPTPARSRQ